MAVAGMVQAGSTGSPQAGSTGSPQAGSTGSPQAGSTGSPQAAGDLTLWYGQPARSALNEGLPIGNGKFGGLICGDARLERVVLNEISLWTGDEKTADGSYGKMGAYQMLGELFLATGAKNTNTSALVSNYRRALDLATALHAVTYTSGGVTYRRESFASHADGVMVMRLTADKSGSCSGTVWLKSAHPAKVKVEKNTMEFEGALINGLKYLTRVVVLVEGGSVAPERVATETCGVRYENCDSVTLVVAAGTDYSFDYSRNYRGEDPRFGVEQRLAAASSKPYETLKQVHVADFQSLFNRVELEVGATPADRLALPTNQRAALQTKQGGDPDLEELIFQYGRYLMISCSRAGGLPANLQGLWNESNNPPWHSDYHANINIQMNYWLAEPANLAECHTTLFDLITSQLEPWRKATARDKGFVLASGKSGGWAVRTSHGIHGDMGWQWDKTANAWYCQHFWWHYVYSGDKEWLKKVAYPVMKEVCEFWEARIKTLPDGTLVVPNGWSPEQGPLEDGVSYSQEIAWDLFNNYVAASQALDVDADYRAKIAAMRDKLLVPKIGKWGQLQEWMTDRDDPNNHHRHTSHLFGVFPGEQFSVAKTPALAKAAKVSLDARGAEGDVREWSYAWRTALYARMHDGESAHFMFQKLFGTVCVNLFGNHPPMQMDGNFGITAGVCEMLMQSYAGEIALIPAIPAVWSTGSVKGLRARGGFTADIEWKDGKVTRAKISSTGGTACKVRAGDKTTEFSLKPGQSITVNGELKTL
jgi:alpha-L-fucosidase 2